MIDFGEGAVGMTDFSLLCKVIYPIAERYGVDKVYLFGSRARGNERIDSDYDFLISKGKINNLWLMASFWEDIETALKAPVDVITDTSSDHSLINAARKDAKLIYERTR